MSRMCSSKGRFMFGKLLDVTVWLAVSCVVFYLFAFGSPYKNGFFCDDKSLRHPFIQETISTPVLVAIGLTVSVMMVFLVEILNCLENVPRKPCHLRTTLTTCVKNYLVFLLGFLIQTLFVEAIKNKMGMLRPSFFDVCKPEFNATLCTGYISEYTCTGSDETEIRSSRQSFPSGHSSFSMYIAVYFCIYIDHRLKIRFSKLLKLFLQIGLILTAIMCGLGRIKENKHHPSDVIAGYLLGFTVAIFVHYMLGKMRRSRSKSNDPLSNAETNTLCCSYEKQSDTDQRNPLSLLESEYIKTLDSERNTPSTKLQVSHHSSHQNITSTSDSV